jgi:hypothetical protein
LVPPRDSGVAQVSGQARWEPPRPYGYPAALDGMGTIAAPLLASVSIALVAIVLTSAASFKLETAALLFLVLAAASLVAAVEFCFMTRKYVVTPSEIEAWWPDHAMPGRLRSLRREQRYYHARFKVWTVRARCVYDVGVLALSLGIVALLVPNRHLNAGHGVVIALAGAAFLGELAWAVVTRVRQEVPEFPEVAPEPVSGSS